MLFSAPGRPLAITTLVAIVFSWLPCSNGATEMMKLDPSTCGTGVLANAFSCMLDTSGAYHFVTVPPYATEIQLRMWGGSGASWENVGGTPGAFIKGTLAVVPGETLRIIIGLGGEMYASAKILRGYPQGTDAEGCGGAGTRRGGGRSAIQRRVDGVYSDVATAGGGGGSGGCCTCGGRGAWTGIGWAFGGGSAAQVQTQERRSGGGGCCGSGTGTFGGGGGATSAQNSDASYTLQYCGGSVSGESAGGGGGWYGGGGSGFGGGGGGSSYTALLTSVTGEDGTVAQTDSIPYYTVQKAGLTDPYSLPGNNGRVVYSFLGSLCSAGSISGSGGCVACANGAYNYDGGSATCATCPPGSTVKAGRNGCSPLSPTGASDTALYLSGTAVEGVGAYRVIKAAGVLYSPDRFRDASSALNMSAGSYLSVPISLPSGTSAFSAAAWVMCNASSPAVPVIQWGNADVPGASAQILVEATPSSGTATTKCTQGFQVTRVVGTGTAGNADGPALSLLATLELPSDMIVDASGIMYVATQNGRIRKVAPDGSVATLAGTGISGWADGPGNVAKFASGFIWLALDSSGNVYVSEHMANRIRKITPSGVVSTVAGSTDGSSGHVDGAGVSARFNRPGQIAFDSAGNLYVGDTANNVIRKINTAGFVSTFASGQGMGSSYGIAVDRSGIVFSSEYATGRVLKFDSAGVMKSFASGLSSSYSLDIDAAGNLYVACGEVRAAKKITPSGVVSTFAGSGAAGSADGSAASATFSMVASVRIGANGEAYVADTNNHMIRRISRPGCTFSVCDSKWHHVAQTYAGGNGGLLSTYLDGSLAATTIAALFINSDITGWVFPVATNTLVGGQGQQYSEVGEGGTLTFNCRGGTFSNVAFASYGTPTGVFPTFATSWCHAGSSLDVVTRNCIGQSSCAVSGQNSIFGDPCSGTYKKFIVSLQCTVDTNYLRLASSNGGAISDVRIYTRALSATQVAALVLPVLPAFANAVNPTASVNARSYSWGCAPGYAGPAMEWTMSSDNSWSKSGGPLKCSVCAAGSYSYGSNSTSCTACPAGLFGSSTGLMTSSCSGACDAGFYCPAGSTSARQVPCGDVSVYCPTGSGAPVTVPAGHYATPLSAPLTQRSSISVCLANRKCLGGVLYPPLDFSASCPSGKIDVELYDDEVNKDFGPTLAVATAGWATPTLKYTVTKTAVEPGRCPLQSYMIGLAPSGSNSPRLRVGAQPIDAAKCGAGFVFDIIKAAREPESTNDTVVTYPGYQDKCKINVYVAVALRAPIISLCTDISIAERLPIGTNFGQIIRANSSTTAATLAFSVNSSVSIPSPGLATPFQLTCDGAMISTRMVLYQQAQSWNLTLRVDNVGVGDVKTSYCAMVVRVLPRPEPPTLTTDALTLYDQAAVGTLVGNVGAVSNNNVGSTLYTANTSFSVVDTPDVFSINLGGNVTVSAAALDATIKGVYTYSINASDAISWAVYPFSITLLVSPRPPATVAQSLMVSDTATAWTTLAPALYATHPQGFALTFSLVDASGTFGVFSNGTVYVRQGAVLDYNIVPSYSMTFSVMDINSKIVSSYVTVTVVETNKAPRFSALSFLRKVSESSVSGSALDGVLSATDENKRDALTYSIVSCQPKLWAGGLCPFVIDAAEGSLRVASLPSGAQLMADRNASYMLGPFNYSLVVIVVDNGTPQLSASSAVYVQVANIAPRVLPATVSIFANASASTIVADIKALTWTAYASALAFTFLGGAPISAENVTAFAIHPSTGLLTVASPAPAWSYNTKRVYSFTIVCVDDVTGLTGVASVTVQLLHVNRAPLFAPIPAVDVPARSLSNVMTLSSYVSDADLDLGNLGEKLTYSLGELPNGNTDTTFGISSSTGALFVRNASTPSFLFNSSAGLGTSYNVTVNACDAGIDGPVLCAASYVVLTVVAGSVPPLMADTTFMIAENTVAGTSVGRVAATDEQGYAIYFRLQSGDAAGVLAISVTGTIVVTGSLNFEVKSVYTLVVAATNNGPYNATASATVTVRLTDVNESPLMPATTALSVDENSVVGTAIGSVIGTDEDAADIGKLTYSLVTTGTPFVIGTTSGAITVASATLDYETSGSYTLIVRVRDSGWGSTGTLTGDGTILVTINNRNDSPVLADASGSVFEGSAVATQIATVRAVDQDAGQQMQYALSRASSVCWAFTISAAQSNAFPQALQFVPFALPTVAAGVQQTLLFRVKGSGGILLVLSATASTSSERYEILLNRAGSKFTRYPSLGSASILLDVATTVLLSSAVEWTHLSVIIDRTAKKLFVGTRLSNAVAESITVALTVDDSSQGMLPIARIGVTGTSIGTIISSICFDSATNSAGTTFAIDSAGAITNAGALNYETQQSYGVEVKVIDQTSGNTLLPMNLVDFAVAIITVTDRNEVPAWPALVSCPGSAGTFVACLSIQENSAVSAVLTGAVPAATDPDTLATQSLVYTSKLDGNAASGSRIFDINSLTRVVSLKQSILDYETSPSFTVMLTVTDSGAPTPQLSADASVFVSITDVNEAPVIAATARSVFENVAVGTAVGAVIPASEPDTAGSAFATLVYSIIGGTGQGLFSIGPSSGQIAVAAAILDFEVTETYTLTVKVTDGGGLSAQATVTINILDENEHPSLLGPWTRAITENVGAPSPAGNPIDASDVDANQELSFVLTGGTGTSVFRINKCSGQVELQPGQTVDFETASTYTLIVTVTDDGIPAKSDTKTYTLFVIDADDAPVLANQVRAIGENSGSSALVGLPLLWTDPDKAASLTVAWYTQTFSIIAGNDRSVFALDASTGQLRVANGGAALLNFEDANANVYNLLVKVHDGGGASASATIIVTVTDINEAPNFNDLSYERFIDENCPSSPRLAGENVGTPVLATDADGGQATTMNYSITGGNNDGYFSIMPSGASRGQIQLTAAGAFGLNFESVRQHVLRITIIDAGNLTASTNFTVKVINRNEAPIVSDQTRVMTEADAIGSFIGLPIVASDPEDINLRFVIIGGNAQGVFTVNAATGQLSLANTANLNYEAPFGSSYTLTLDVTDTGAPDGTAAALTSTFSVVVAVLDVNEAPTMRASTFIMAENKLSGSVIGEVNALVADVDQVDTRTYSILSQEDTFTGRSPFVISNTTGTLSVAAGSPDLDYERKRAYRLVVQVTDKGGLKTNATMLVTLTNINEPPVWMGIPNLYARAFELQDVGQGLIAFIRDQDTDVTATNEQLTFRIVGGNGSSIFAVASASGQISVVNNNSLSFPVGGPGPVYTLLVEVTDAGVGGSSLSATATVTVKTVDNNRPPTIQPYTVYIDENSVPGSEVGRVYASDGDWRSGQIVTYTLDASGVNINRAFPLNITTLAGAGTNNMGLGVIRVIWDAVPGSLPWTNLDFEAPRKKAASGALGFNVFTSTVTATDSHETRLSSIAPVRVILCDVPEAPFFHASRIPRSGRFILTLLENSAAGSQLHIDSLRSSFPANIYGGMSARDDDIVDADLNMTYVWKTDTTAAGTLASYFSLDPRTGVVTLTIPGAVNGLMNFESARRVQNLFVIVTDTTGRMDAASVSVELSDVNEVQTWNGTGILDFNGFQATRLQIAEGSAAGTVVGRMSALDVDAGVAGVMEYSLRVDAEAMPFAIDSATGLLTVSSGGLDWEDKDIWSPTVIVKDASLSPFTITMVVPIHLLDVNDVVVGDIRLVPGVDAPEVAETVNASSLHGVSHAGMSILYRSSGGVQVILSGSGFGWTSSRIARAGTASPTTILATYGSVGLEYTATSCSVVSAGSEISCTTAPGSGVGHIWRVQVTTTSPRAATGSAYSTVKSGYLPPTLHAVHLLGVSNSDIALNQMDTTGAADIRVAGSNLGPSTSRVVLRYGPSLNYQTGRCAVEVEHASVICTAVAGIGGLPFQFSLQVDVSSLQVSSVFTASQVRYFPPSIESVDAPTLNTRGSETITINGRNLGPAGTLGIVLEYANAWQASTPFIYLATACASFAGSAHRKVKCTSAPGVGAAHRLRITVGGQASALSAVSTSISYRSPVIMAVSGPGAEKAVTEGGQTVLLTGDQFGPATYSAADGGPLPGAIVPASRYGRAVAGNATVPGQLMYNAVSCRVTSDHTQIVCFTAPGTGKELLWEVSVDGLSSGLFMGGMTNYAAPVVAQYTGAGSSAAETSGGQEVVINGFNFGPIGSPVDSVLYGQDGREFAASGCAVTVAHARVVCNTVVGAGKDLRWMVTIDGQESTTPTTDYGAPIIDSISGAGASSASTDGGQIVVLHGRFFSINMFLEKVTYGPGGIEYTASDCVVNISHVQIHCKTVPGTGRVLHWIVTVRGQESLPSVAVTSYAAPVITAVEPAEGPTSGGLQLRVTGKDLGLMHADSKLEVRVNSLMVASPSASTFRTYIDDVYAGKKGPAEVSTWITALEAPRAIFPQYVPGGVHSVDFILPEGFGAGRELLLVVDGVPSNTLTIDYLPPAITNLAPDRQEVKLGQLRLFVEGVNFCSGHGACGELLVDGVKVSPTTHSHTRIVAIVADPSSSGKEVTVEVMVNGVRSNLVSFSTPVPSFDALSGQGNWGGASSTVVEKAVLTFSISLGGAVTPVQAVDPTVAGPLRSAIGSSAGVPTNLVTITSVTDIATGAVTSVRSSDPANTVPAARLLAATGVNITVALDVGETLVSSGIAVSPVSVASLVANVSEGLKKASFLSAVVSAVVASTGVSVIATIDVQTIASVIDQRTVAAGQPMSTRGGDRFYIANVASLASVIVADIKITIDGQLCTGLTKTDGVDLGPQYGVPADSPLAAQYKTYNLECLTPAWVGSDLPIRVSVPGGLSQDNPGFRFSYAAPNITAIVSDAQPALSLTAKDSSGRQVEGIPTLGMTLRIVGSNFGSSSIMALVRNAFKAGVTVTDTLASKRIAATIVSHDHEAIVVAFPAGQGKDIAVSLAVGAQTNTDSIAGSGTRPATFVRYRAPSITRAVHFSLSDAQGGPTLGGLTLTLTGTDFGLAALGSRVEDGRPLIAIGGRPATIASTWTPWPDHSRLDVLLPEGWGKDLPVAVTVSGQSSASPVMYTYAPPTVTSLTPVSGPTSGRTVAGSVINMTLTGTNLGRIGSIELRPTSIDETAFIVVVPHSAMYTHTHTNMTFVMPEGAGANLQIVAIVGGQDSSAGQLSLFTYDPPVIAGVVNAERTVGDCMPRPTLIRISNGTYVNKTVYPAYPGCYATIADPPYTLRVTGESFGAPAMPMRISVGVKSCELVSHTHNEALCIAPEGMGDKNPVIMTVGGRSSTVTRASTFAYDPPVITAIMPNRPDAALGQGIDIYGHNFGPVSAPVTVFIGGKECYNASWFNDGLINCNTQPDVVGRKNVTVLAANRTEPVVWFDVEGIIEFRCKRGFYGLKGETCVECGTDAELGMERGAKCPGEEMDNDLVMSLPGWWRFNVSEPVQCHPLRVHRAFQTEQFGGGCPLFVACEPIESCLGANQCAPQYAGARCASCAKSFYRVNGECIKCPDSPWAVVIVFVVAAMAALGVAYFLNSKNVNLALISIGMDWAQVVAMFARTRIRWPALVKELFLFLSAFNLNLELIAPECAIPEVTYSGKWLFIEGLPILGWGLLFIAFFLRVMWKFCILRRNKKSLYTHLPVLVATGTVVQRVLYLYTTRTTLDVFNCSPTDPPEKDKNGVEILYMAWNLDIQCNGSTHVFLLPFAVFALIIYVVGLPLLSLWWLRKNKEIVKYDQILRAQMSGDDRLSNPYYSFRKTWKALYMNYRPGSWFWEFVVVMRKFLIAFCSLMFRRTPSYQLAMALLVLFVSYVLQVRTLPYFSHTMANNALQEHRNKVMEGNALHCRIEDQMRAIAVANARKGTAGGGSIDAGMKKRVATGDIGGFLATRRTKLQEAVLRGRRVILSNPTATFMFDYNTAEAVLLASAVLINLAGICFDSSRFAGEMGKRREVMAEYDSLSFAILVIMLLSIVYWFSALIMDIALLVSPSTVSHCLASLSKAGLKALDATKRMKLGKQREDQSTNADMSDEMQLMNNPVMMAAAMNGSQDGRAMASMNVADVKSMIEPPDAPTWGMIRSSYSDLVDKSRAAQRDIERMRNLLEVMGVDGEGRPIHDDDTIVYKRSKKPFDPLSSEGAKSPKLSGLLSGFNRRTPGQAKKAVERLSTSIEEEKVFNPMSLSREKMAVTRSTGSLPPPPASLPLQSPLPDLPLPPSIPSMEKDFTGEQNTFDNVSKEEDSDDENSTGGVHAQ